MKPTFSAVAPGFMVALGLLAVDDTKHCVYFLSYTTGIVFLFYIMFYIMFYHACHKHGVKFYSS